MKLPFHFLLAATLAASQPLLTDGQSLFTPKPPPGSIWQPLPTPKYKDLSREEGRFQLPDLSQPGDNAIRTLPPDNMPCVVPNLNRVERMPVDRRGNADPINRMAIRDLRLSIQDPRPAGHKKRAM